MTQALREALAELVALNQFKAEHTVRFSFSPRDWDTEDAAAEYRRRKPLAWAAARAALSAPTVEAQATASTSPARLDLYDELAEALGCQPYDSHAGRLEIARRSHALREAEWKARYAAQQPQEGGIQRQCFKAGARSAAPAVSRDAMEAFDAAVAAELPLVSEVEYNSQAICKWFAGNVRDRMAALATQPAAEATEDHDRRVAAESLANSGGGHARRLTEVATFLRGAKQAMGADVAVDCDRAANWIHQAGRALATLAQPLPQAELVQERWQPIETCPNNTSVLFFVHGRIEVGRMEHDALRMGGHRMDHFCGGSWADDEHPPTHWMPLSAAPPVEAAAVVPILAAEQVEWVTNDNAELGVKIGNQFFFCYKGRSLVYGTCADETIDGIVQHDDGGAMHWRPVFKREFGECIHPINYADPTRIGTVSLNDSGDWKPLPAAPKC